MFYELRNENSFLRIDQNLETLEYGNEKQCYRAENLLSFSWSGIPITAKNVMHKKITETETSIDIELAQFIFAARFPGNDYCRPDPRFTPDFKLHILFCLDQNDLVIKISSIENIEGCHINVMVAQELMQISTFERAALYVPIDYGMRFDFPRNDIFKRTFRPSSEWSLPAHGLFGSSGGIGMWCEDVDRDYIISYNNDMKGTLNVVCREIFNSMANDPRELRFMLFDAGTDFRDLSRRCRALRIASGRFQTYAQKAKNNHIAEQLPGTVFWKHNVYFTDRPKGVTKSYSLYTTRPNWNENEGLPGNWTAKEVFETAMHNGFDRVAVCNTGWNYSGFDAGYPKRFPINPERGTEADFYDAAINAQKLSKGYFLNVHDNYEDAYQGEDFKLDEMAQAVPGSPQAGGVWRGGQSYKLCSSIGLKYAKRDLPRLARISGKGCIYIDVFANTYLTCCWSKLHPQTRRQDWLSKRELCKLALELFGAIAVEGCGTDLYADLINIGAYGRLHIHDFPARSDGPIPVPVPMWQMVYHDSVLNYYGEGYLPVHGSEYRLYQALYTLLPTSFDEHSKRLSFELRDVYTTAMVDFTELVPRSVTYDSDGSFHTHGVARSLYANGTEIVCNFEESSFTYEGKTIAPRDFIILTHLEP